MLAMLAAVSLASLAARSKIPSQLIAQSCFDLHCDFHLRTMVLNLTVS